MSELKSYLRRETIDSLVLKPVVSHFEGWGVADNKESGGINSGFNAQSRGARKNKMKMLILLFGRA